VRHAAIPLISLLIKAAVHFGAKRSGIGVHRRSSAANKPEKIQIGGAP
jgi:hypothetical protein